MSCSLRSARAVFSFFFLIDSAAPKLNHRFLFRPWFIFRALCEPPNKNTPQNSQLRRLLVLHLFPVPQTGSHIQDKHVINLVFFGQCCKLPILVFSIDLSVCNLQYGPKPRLILKRYLLPSRVWYLLGKVSLHVFHPTLVCHNFEQGQLARARLQDRRRCWNSLRGLYHRSSRRSSYSNRSYTPCGAYHRKEKITHDLTRVNLFSALLPAMSS